MRIEPGGETVVTIHTADEDETRAIAARLAAEFAGGEVIGLRGDLGTGKTVFVQGLAQGLGASEPATSPGFVIMHQYPGRLLLCHVDLYRLDRNHVEGLGLDEVIASDTVVAIEWSERLPQRLRQRLLLDVAIEFGAGERDRTLRIVAAQAMNAERLHRALTALACAWQPARSENE